MAQSCLHDILRMLSWCLRVRDSLPDGTSTSAGVYRIQQMLCTSGKGAKVHHLRCLILCKATSASYKHTDHSTMS